MVSAIKKLRALMWKCLLLRRRNYLISMFELIFPILIMWFVWLLNEDFINEPDTWGLKSNIITHDPRIISVPETPLRIAYSPSNQKLKRLMNNFKDSLNKRFKIKFSGKNQTELKSNLYCDLEPKNDEKDVDRWLLEQSSEIIQNRTNTPNNLVGIVFLKSNLKDKIFSYKIRTLEDIKTNHITIYFLDESSNEYNNSIFISVQHLLDCEILEFLGVKVKDVNMYFGPLPERENFNFFHQLFFFLNHFAYIFLVVSTMREVVEEKRTGLKELMKLMGVSTWMIWIHVYAYILIIHLPSSLVVTYFIAFLEPVMVHGNFFIVWLLVIMFVTTITILSFVFSCFFTNVALATSLAIVSYASLSFTFFYYIYSITYIGTPMQVVSCLVPSVNLGLALDTLESFSRHDIEWNMKYLFSKGFSGSHISVGMSLVISVLEILVLIPILICLDAAFPGPFGRAKRPNFAVMWSKILQKCKKIHQPEIESSRSRTEAFEKPPVDTEVGIQIRALCKEYGICKKVLAVDRVDLNVYKGEIMTVLGHNGAGKTSLLSMIAGMFYQTSGVILVDEYDIRHNLSRFRESLGMCTQHNLYFPKFTSLEHLQFFGMVRGMSFNEATHSGKEILTTMQMSDSLNKKSATLSGGMQRRLCLAMALVGSPKTLILDEPTSGLDPESRRKIWDIILSVREQRTILVATHFMEEADVLGDRISIMHQGRLVCCGTTMFLKRLYGVGYNIHIQKKYNSQADVIKSLIQTRIPSLNMRKISERQLDFILNSENVDRFPSLFSLLENKANDVGITGISISSTTMEDVFLKVANESNNTDHDSAFHTPIYTQSPRQSAQTGEVKPIKGGKLLLQRLTVLLFKRYIYRFRNNTAILIITIVNTFLSLFLAAYEGKTIIKNILKGHDTQNPLSLKLSLYPGSLNPIIYDEYNEIVAKAAIDLIRSQKGTVEVLQGTTNISNYSKDMIKNYENKFVTRTLLGITMLKNEYIIQFQPKFNKHTYPIAVNLMSNTLLKNNTGYKRSAITVINQPFSIPGNLKVCKNAKLFPKHVTMKSILWILLFFNIITRLLADNISFIAEEHVSGFKLQQSLAGMSPFVYWVTNFIFDYSVFCLLSSFMVIFLAFGEEHVLSSSMTGLLFLVFSLIGLSGIPFTYVFATLLKGSSLKITLFWCQSAIFGCLAPIFIIRDREIVKLHNFVACAILISLNPIFPSVMCAIGISTAISWTKLCLNCGFEHCKPNILKMPSEKDRSGILIYLIMLILTWIMYTMILLLLDYGFFRKVFILFKNKTSEVSTSINADKDVEMEANLVKEYKEIGMLTPLRVEALIKTYSSGPAAVNKVSFLVMKGECFGLLGVNGAGKTTTFKMLTGQIVPDSGDAFVYQYSVIRDTKNYLKSVGYCPQCDAILEKLTTEEVLKIIGKLRGIPRSKVKEEVERWLELCDISKYAKRKVKEYSGGTKRKLSIAMAFIGDPDVVFLDEPTTGVDPVSRRKLWSVIKSRQMAGQAVVLTSHNMDECEALCSRLTIMVGGVMKCIGSVDYLKTKFGKGYTVQVKLIDHTDVALSNLNVEFYRSFPSAIIKDQHKTMIHYQVLDQSIRLSKIFNNMILLKNNHSIIEDFIVRNATLEEFFVSFARNDINDIGVTVV